MNPLYRFEFSQSSLQDFMDCRRRFQLRYIQRVAWPAVPAEPARENERHIVRGERFHRLAQQYLIGVPKDRLERFVRADRDDCLPRWWDNFTGCLPQEIAQARMTGGLHVETTLSAPLDLPQSRCRLVAKFDLVLVRPNGQVVIYDWKTSTHRPSRSWLMQRMQTRVYPYLLARAGACLNDGCSFDPHQISMIYWFAEPGQPPEVLNYSSAMYRDDEQSLREMVTEIIALSQDGFTMGNDERNCRYCVYRSLCGRGDHAGEIEPGYEAEDGHVPDFGLEQIGEISF